MDQTEKLQKKIKQLERQLKACNNIATERVKIIDNLATQLEQYKKWLEEEGYIFPDTPQIEYPDNSH